MGSYFSSGEGSGSKDAKDSDPAAKSEVKGVVADKTAIIRFNLSIRAYRIIGAIFGIAGLAGILSYLFGGVASFIIAFIAPLLSAVLVLTCCVMVPVCLSPDLWKLYPWNVLLLLAVTFVQASLAFLMAGYSRSAAIPAAFLGASVSCWVVALLGTCTSWHPGPLNAVALGTIPSLVFGALMFIDPNVTVFSAIVAGLLGCTLGVWALLRVRWFVGGPADPIPRPGGDTQELTLVLLLFTEAFTATICNPLRWYGAEKLFSTEQKEKAGDAVQQAAKHVVGSSGASGGAENRVNEGAGALESKSNDDDVLGTAGNSEPAPAPAAGASAEHTGSSDRKHPSGP